MLHSISDLTTLTKPTTGDVPAKLVGASTTVIGNKMYLFGGRLVSERRMTNDLYAFDLETYNWERVSCDVQDSNDAPRPRYFHSSDSWNNHLVIFGGMSNKTDANSPEDLCVLNDIRILDLSTKTWLSTPDTNPFSVPSFSDPPPESLLPRARYAHLSSVTADRLFIIGGQDIHNVWLDDACIYDFKQKQWVRRTEYPRHCGTYRSVAVSAELCVQRSQDSIKQSNSVEPGTRFRVDSLRNQPPIQNVTPPESIVHLPYSTPPTPDVPCDIYLYSNYNFTDVKRELEVFSPLPSSPEFTISDHSSLMPGPSFPPGLRFPTGAILGTHFIVAGTYLAHTYQSFSIWALDLVSMTWSRIDPGNALATGSWFRSCLWPSTNKFYVFGNRNGNLVDDYNRRLLSWEDVAVVDLEAFGIYQPPPLLISHDMQETGLAALEEGVNADFDLVCDDGRRIKCSRKILEARWPWFKQERLKFLQAAMESMESQSIPPTLNTPLPDVPGVASAEARPDPRLLSRSLSLSEPYAVTMAFLQYMYATSLLTPLQRAPAVLSQLLVLATTYDLPHLASLVKHAMHGALSNTTSVGVYEVATLCDCRSLQIRALKTVMSYSQKRPARTKDKDGGGSDRPEGGSGGTNSTGPDGSLAPASRPRGTSDAYWKSGGNTQQQMPQAPRQFNIISQEPRFHPNRSFEVRDVFDSVDEDGDTHARPSIGDPRGNRPSTSTRTEDSQDLTNDAESSRHRATVLDHRASVSTVAHLELCEVANLFTGGDEDEPTQLEPPRNHRFERSRPSLGSRASSRSDDGTSSSASSERSLFFTPPRRRRAKQLAPIIVRGQSDSDTPSLTSSTSTSSIYTSKRRSPITPLSATSSMADHLPPGLTSIAERRFEAYDNTFNPGHSVDYSQLDFDYSSTPAASPTVLLTPSIVSSSGSDTISGGQSSFFHKKSKEGKRPDDQFLALDLKAAKAEEKKRKKAETRARTERLAMELRYRQGQRGESSSQSSGDSREKKTKGELPSMYSFGLLG